MSDKVPVMMGSQKKTRSSFALVLGTSMLLSASAAFAGSRPAPEVYLATENNGLAGIAPSGNQMPVAVQTETPPPLTPSPAASAPTASKNHSTEATFDAVPMEQIEPFLKRIRLVEELLEKYGRAYDYRVHTVRDLEVIRAQLEIDAQTRSSNTSHVAPAVTAVPTSPTPSDAAIAQKVPDTLAPNPSITPASKKVPDTSI